MSKEPCPDLAVKSGTSKAFISAKFDFQALMGFWLRASTWFIPSFLNLSPIDILGEKILCWDAVLHWKWFSNIRGYCP